MPKLIDITGHRFGNLTVIGQGERTKNGRIRWSCLCDCGNKTLTFAYDLKNGKVVSCGCYHRESLTVRNTTHGGSNTRLFRVWCGMRERCSTPSCKAYANYGGRGISVCDEWNDYAVFYKWAVSTGYEDGLSIDRIDSNGNYCPENCRWATSTEQANNTRRNVKIAYKGVSHTISEWSKIFGIKYTTLYMRLQRGMSIEKAFRNPTKGVVK